MAGGKMEAGGELVAHLARLVPLAVWAPDRLPAGQELNPFGGPRRVSEAMERHLAAWKRRKFRAAAGG